MRIIGFDPGLADTGFGIIEVQGSRIVCLEYGSIKTPAKMELSVRLLEIYKKVSELLKKYKPERAGIEKLFFSKNVKTAMAVGQARGVILLALAEAKLSAVEFTPNQVKQAVSAYGSASKTQIQRMVQVILNLPELPRPDDAADALAVAICTCGHQREKL